jgi:hypothetical protein
MINFSRASARPQQTVIAVQTEVPVVQETITIKPVPRRLGDAAADASPSDGWEKLRDYVVERVEALHGPFPRDTRQETTIFMAFTARWPQAMEIAKYAFEGEPQGFWKGAPVRVERFHRVSDPYFAEPISVLLSA